METIEELERYLEEECFSFNEISIGKHHAPEGIIIEKASGKYVFACSERGCREIIKSFSREKDLVDYALKKLDAEEWKGHLIAWVWSEKDIKKAEEELKRMNVGFKRNDIPGYLEGKCAYRIFVFGKDVLLIDEKFKERYFQRDI